MATTSCSDVLHDFSPLLRVYKDGRVERFVGQQLVPASVDRETGVECKDVKILGDVSARLYRPSNLKPGQKIPLLVYFHGGGFVIESAFSSQYQNHLNLLVREANVLMVSVDYRLAPEHPLPVAYEDSWLALQWIASHSKGQAFSGSEFESEEEWIRDYADLNRVYFGGDSAGGNLAHNMAMKVGLEGLDGVNLAGIFLNCPYFWGKDPIGDEASKPEIKKFMDNLWLFVYPETTGLDDPLVNPAADPNLSRLGCKNVLILLAGEDPLRHRGRLYKEELEKSGWNGKAEIVEFEREFHVFNLMSPKCENAISMLKALASFLNYNNYSGPHSVV